MKWVKTAIGAVIAIVSIGIVAASVHGMTQEKVKEEVVTFELLTETTVTSGTFDLISDFLTEGYTNVTIIYNDTTYNGSIFYNITQLEVFIEPDYIIINNDDIWLQEDSQSIIFNVGDIIEIAIEVTQPPQLSGISAVLLWVIPIIFTSAFLSTLIILLPEKEV